MPKPEKPLATITSANASLMLVLLDAGLLESWEPLDEDTEGDDIGGHPQKVIDLLDEDEDFVAGPLTVGDGKALVLTLDGATGEAEVRRLGDGTLVFVEPPREWWDDADNFGKRKADVAALFEDVLGPAPKAGKEKKIGNVAVRSGKVVAFDSNADLGGAAKAAKKAAEGKVVPFGEDDAGVVIGLSAGDYVVARRVVTPKWADDMPLVVAYVRPA